MDNFEFQYFSLTTKVSKADINKKGLKKHIAIIAIVFMAITSINFTMPQKAMAATPTVKIGGVSISSYNDNKWHAYNSKKPTISGWKAGKYKLSQDGKTLYIDGFKYSGSKRGISSTAALKVVASGTNTFTCNGARGICLENSNDETKNLTLAGASNSTLTLKCTNAMAIAVNSLTMSSGTVNATGTVDCEANLSITGGKLTVIGQTSATGNLTASGGSLTASKGIYADNLTINGGTVTSQSGGVDVINNLSVSKGSLTSKTTANDQDSIYVGVNATVSGTGKVTTTAANASSISVYGTLTVSGGTIDARNKIVPDSDGAAGYNMNIAAIKMTGGNITARNEGTAGNAITVEKTLTISGGTITATSTNASSDWYSIQCGGNISASGGTVTASNGIWSNNLTINGGTVTSQSTGVALEGNLSVSKGSLTSKTTGNVQEAISTNGNATVSGTGKVIASAGNATSCYIVGTFTVSGGSVEGSNKAVPNSENRAYSNVYANTLNVTGGTLTARAEGTAGRAINTGQSLTISGGTINAISTDTTNTWCTVGCAGDITASGGKLSAVNSGSAGIYIEKNLNVSGTADVSGTTNGNSGVSVNGVITIDGGKLSGKSNLSTGVWTPSITVNAGQLTGSGGSHGIYANDLHVDGGTILGETNENGFNGIYIDSSFVMTGGRVSGKVNNEYARPIGAPLEGVNLSDDIWMSEPSDGYNTLNSEYEGWGYLYEFNHDGSDAKAATFQKVTGLSVKKIPSTTFYEEDAFDPSGLVLSLTFEDGTVSDLSYDEKNKEMFSFSILEGSPLSQGKHHIDVTCLTKKAGFDINAKPVGSTTLSGTPYIESHRVKWTKADGATRYRLYGKEQGTGQFKLLGDYGVLQFLNSGLSPGETWEYYTVPVRHSTSGVIVLGPESNHITLTCELNAPEIKTSATTFNSIDIAWEDTIGATSYDIYRSEAGGDFTYCGSIAGLEDKEDDGRYIDIDDESVDQDRIITFTDKGLVTGREYTYYVKAAIPEKDLYSVASNKVKATPEFKGKASIKLEGKGPYTLKWDAVDGATGYEVMRGSGANGSRTLIATIEGTSYVDKSADVYSVYNYTVIPVRTVDGNTFRGLNSSIVVTTAKDKPAPAAPKIKPPTAEDPSGTTFNLLQAKSGKITKRSVQIKWKKVKGASKYVIYGNKCGIKTKYKKIKTTTKNKLTFKKVAGHKVAKGTYYKFLVYAVDKNGEVISTSKTVHVVTKGGKYGNDGRVTTAAKKGKVALKKGQTFKLKAKAIPASKKHKVRRHRSMAYETSNSKVATVTFKGMIKAKSKGTCYVYAYTQNGISKKIKVTVK